MSDALRHSLAQHFPEAIDWLQRMVEINSFTANPAGVDALGQLTAECFQELGFQAEQVPSERADFGHHLFLTKPMPGAPRIVLVTHLDTVFPPEEEQRNDFHWQPAPDEGRIYGPGTVDIKGGTALIWLILKAMREVMPEVFNGVDWLIAANASEEVMATDFARFTAERCPAGAAAVLVFEGGPIEQNEYHLVTARKGRAEYRLTAHGKGAHAGSAHDQGINAIVDLAPVIQAAAALTDPAREITVNIGHVQGGTVLNRVPHLAAIELETRTFDPELLQQTGAALEALSREASPGSSGIEVERIGLSPSWPDDERTRGLARYWQEAGTELGLRTGLVKRGGLSDANYLCGLGPTLDGLGPAGANAHCSERTPDGSKLPEYVETTSFLPKALLNLTAIRRLIAAVKRP
ncbi:MAG: M20/M25/M40 family metallo-hydrolase [Verrucomicrobiaceae bacterium]|nr:M20/M25/M40 family metallo-hydrolase [Verrucomicrobiaceae bacterium]